MPNSVPFECRIEKEEGVISQYKSRLHLGTPNTMQYPLVYRQLALPDRTDSPVDKWLALSGSRTTPGYLAIFGHSPHRPDLQILRRDQVSI